MILLRKIGLYLLSLGIPIFVYLFIKQPEKIIYWSIFLAALTLLLIKLAVGKKINIKNFLAFFTLITVFEVASIFFLSLLESHNLYYPFIVFISFLIFYFMQLLYQYAYLPEEYQPFSLSLFSRYLTFLYFYFIATTGFAFSVAIIFSTFTISTAIAVLFLIFIAYDFWLEKISLKKNRRYFLTFFFLIWELNFLICWLPFSYFVRGLLLAWLVYFCLYFILKYINKDFNRKNFILFFIGSLIITIILLATTRWF